MGESTQSQQTEVPRRHLVVAMDDYEPACKIVTAFEALQSLRLLIQHEIQADKAEMQLEQVLSSLECVEYAMRRAIDEL